MRTKKLMKLGVLGLLVVSIVLAHQLTLAVIEEFSVPTKAVAGEEVEIEFRVRNDGVMGKIWVRIFDLDTNQVYFEGNMFLRHNEVWVYEFSIKMPERDLRLRMEAGHYEHGGLAIADEPVLDSWVEKEVNLQYEGKFALITEFNTPTSAYAGQFFEVSFKIAPQVDQTYQYWVRLKGNDDYVFYDTKYLQPNEVWEETLTLSMPNDNYLLELTVGHFEDGEKLTDDMKQRTVLLLPEPEKLVEITEFDVVSYAYAGDTLSISFEITNLKASNTFWIRILDGSDSIYYKKVDLAQGESFSDTISYTMPNRDLYLTIQAGHFENGNEILDALLTKVVRLLEPREGKIIIENVTHPLAVRTGFFNLNLRVKNVGDSDYAWISIKDMDRDVEIWRKDMYLKGGEVWTESIKLKMEYSDRVIRIEAGHLSELDSVYTFTIYYLPEGEGKFVIHEFEGSNYVKAGDIAWVYFKIENVGKKDIGYIKVSDAKTGEIYWEEKKVIEGVYEQNITFRMPNKDLLLKLEVGHDEDGKIIIDAFLTLIMFVGPLLARPEVLGVLAQGAVGAVYFSGIDKRFWIKRGYSV